MTPSQLQRRFEKLFQSIIYRFEDKTQSITDNFIYMLNRTLQIFEWRGLPDSIPSRNLELYLQLNGNACFYRPSPDSPLYVFQGGRGGEPDVYYEPTIYTISNPALNLTAQPRIGIDCIVMPNDSLYQGLFPLLSRTATMLCENELSMQMAIIQSRMPAIITADTDNDQLAGEKYIKDIIDGKLGIYKKNNILQSVGTHPIAQASARTLTDLIEVQQYIKASWYNDIGLNSNYNMKREQINSVEAQLNDRALFPLVDDMLKCRKEYADDINTMYGTNITVGYSELWQAEYNDSMDEKEGENDEPTASDTPESSMGKSDT